MNTTRWKLPADLLAQSIRFMQPHGEKGNEGLVLWFGHRIAGDTIEVTHAVEPRGSGITRSPLHLSLSISAMSALLDLGETIDRYLVGQIHSHPEWYIDLSPVDRLHGMRIQDYLSVVCPHYAQEPATRWDDCGVHEFAQGRYRRIPLDEASNRIRLSSSSVTTMHFEVRHD